MAKQIIATGTVAPTGRAVLGVSATDATTAQQGQTQAPSAVGQGNSTTVSPVSGAAVTSTSGAAVRAGVRQGDVITAFNGQDDLLTALAHQKPGDTVTLTLHRNGRTVNVRVRLGELSAS